MGFVRGWEGKIREGHLAGAACHSSGGQSPPLLRALQLAMWHIMWLGWASSEKQESLSQLKCQKRKGRKAH